MNVKPNPIKPNLSGKRLSLGLINFEVYAPETPKMQPSNAITTRRIGEVV